MFFQTNILTQPAFFVGFLVLIGYLILNVGSGGLVSNFRPILAGLNQRFNLNAAVIDPYFGQSAATAALEAVGRTTSLVFLGLLVAFFLNILLVALRKVTKMECRNGRKTLLEKIIISIKTISSLLMNGLKTIII